MGAGQFMKNTLDAAGTLRDIEGEMGLTRREKATPHLQDRMGFHLLKRRGYQAFTASSARQHSATASRWSGRPSPCSR
jgi:hypothetical protein